MAAGKNAAAAILEKKGFAVIDADILVHKAIRQTTPLILETFKEPAAERGIKLKGPDGLLDRRALGRLVFSDKILLARQESIVYPVITELIDAFITAHSGQNIVLNATVLYKIPDLMNQCSSIIYIDAPPVIRFFRVVKRDHIKIPLILQRFKTQKYLLCEYQKTGIPVIRISNTGSLISLEMKLLRKLFS